MGIISKEFERRAQAAHVAATTPPKEKGVTVRLPPITICEIDALAAAAGYGSRQSLISALLQSAIDEAVTAFEESSETAAHFYSDAISELLDREDIDDDEYQAHRCFRESRLAQGELL